ncbi:Putative bZIP transcription factor superfamily protein [Zea mays]|uniref:Putative bZIP transcription factor superfamily protein n=1 Tax=Zea mays TaxID=4577 RepID=A0A1D6NSD7_MAIZE|nr:Putative bZIP transcription factor superfamily protein [Zea mays]
MELEAEVAKLKDQNEELQKKQVEMLKKRKTVDLSGCRF